jgi:TonB-dependent receptor
VNGNARAVYSDKSKATDPDLGGSISDTWDTGVGQFGVLVGMSYQRRNYHEERAFNVAPDYQSGQFNAAHPAPVANFAGPFVMGYIPIKGDRRRTAGNFAVEWRPNDATKLYAEGFQTEYKNDFELDFLVGLPFLGNGDIAATVFPGTNQMHTLTDHNVFTIMSTQANRVKQLTDQFAVGGSHDINDLHFSTDLSTTSSTYHWRNPILDSSTIVPDVTVDTNHNGTAQLNYGGAGYNIKDGSTYSLANFFDNYGHDDGHSVDWRADVVWTPSAEGWLRDIRGGVRYADRKAASIKSFVGGTGGPPTAVLANSIPGLAGVSEPMAGGGPDYVTNQWYTPSASFLLDHTDTIRAAFGKGVRPLDPGSYFSDKEVTEAVYLQTSLGGDIVSLPWSSVIGARVVRTDQTLNGNLSQDVLGNGTLVYTPIVVGNKSTDVLPNASFKILFTPELVGRLAVGRTITRPNFPDLNPGVSLSTVVSNTTGLTGSGGNPRLKPVKSTNFDAGLEWYFARAGSLTATGFRRQFNGYVQPSFGYESYGGLQYRVSRPGNTGSGDLNGLELGYQQFYDWLPSVLSGLGLQANFTLMDGKTADVSTGLNRTITGVSKTAFNLIGLYEKGSWSGRLAYNWRSKFIDTYAFATNGKAGTANYNSFDLWARATAQMDGSVSFRVNDKLTFTFEAVNILDTKFKDYFNDPNLYPRDTRRYDRTFELGFRVSL